VPLLQGKLVIATSTGFSAREALAACIPRRGRRICGSPQRLLGADDLEVLIDEDVVRPVDADVVDFVLAVAQLHNAVDDAPRVGGQRGFRRLIRCRSADDRPRPLTVVRRDLTDLL
jgi:hypothetical protein